MVYEQPPEAEAIKKAFQGAAENSATLIKVVAVAGVVTLILWLRKK